MPTVTRATSTSLDVVPEENIDDYWNADGDRDLSDAWTGSTRFTMLDEKPSDGYTWSGERNQTTSRPDSVWPEIWKEMSEVSKQREKQKWAVEKPKLDNARRLRGIYFIDPADAGLKETTKHARRKSEVPMPAAMLCKIRRQKYKGICRTPDTRKTKYACIDEADEDLIAGNGIRSLSHYNLVHKFIPMPEVIKIPDVKAAVDKMPKQLEKDTGMALTKVRNKNEVVGADFKE